MTLKHRDSDPFGSGRYKMVSEHTLTVGRDHKEMENHRKKTLFYHFLIYQLVCTLLYSFLSLLYFNSIVVEPHDKVAQLMRPRPMKTSLTKKKKLELTLI